jgi:hypothetical protein
MCGFFFCVFVLHTCVKAECVFGILSAAPERLFRYKWILLCHARQQPGDQKRTKVREKSTRSARCQTSANSPPICITKREDNTLPLGWQTLRQVDLKFVAMAAVARQPGCRMAAGLQAPAAAAGSSAAKRYFAPQNPQHCGKKFVTLPATSAATAPEYELGNSCTHGHS